MAARNRNPDWEWLSLIDSDGPFLSRAALKSFYPSGLPKADSRVDDVNATFVEEFTRWSGAWSTDADTYRSARDRWVEAVLRDLLEWGDDLRLSGDGIQASSPNGSVSIAPWAVLRTGGAEPSALVIVVDRTDDLRSTGTDGWAADAIDRMALLLRGSATTLGIVTDGRWWALVSAAPDVTTASGVWDALLWREERPSRDAFLALASFASFAGGQPERRLGPLFAESVASAEQITEALGDQVRRAVELVLQSMSDMHLRALAQGDPSPLPEDARVVYDGAVTVLMRIVFLLFAEERGLLPEQDLYRSGYAIAGLREQLEREATENSIETLDHGSGAWHRILAASNAVYGGASFEDVRMPAYGGSLFDPERFPWLQSTDPQGRLRVHLTDRAMLAVLRAVQTIENGAMQLSFRDLDVEQIGYVYEGLLSYSAEYVDEVVVGLQGKSGFEPEIPLVELENIASESVGAADFAKRLLQHLKTTQEKSAPRTANQIARAYETSDADALADARTRLRHTMLGDDALAARLEPFHGLIRDDLRGFPYVVPAVGLVMTESPQRANTGTHYTPRALAEEVVLHALEPLVYSPGPLDTENSSAWKLKSSAEILDLKVADIAAGSGAFLVAAARYLADRLIEARAAEGLNVSRESDLHRWAIREIVARCLYGADINGMAVEMCKLSLWLISMDPSKPFSFVDDRVFNGNSLLGVITEAQLKAHHIYPKDSMKRPLAAFDVDKDLEDAARLRRELASGQVDDADRMRSTKTKRALLDQSRRLTTKLRDVADGIVAVGLIEGGKPGRKLEERYNELSESLRDAYFSSPVPERTRIDALISAGLSPTVNIGERRWKALHWILEVPDVFIERGGFDAIIGNPPFLGGQKLTGAMGTPVRDYLVEVIGYGRSGSADLVAYFLLRCGALLRPGGVMGLVATNTVGQGATREVGLDQIVERGATIIRSIQSNTWPARSANLEYAAVWVAKRSIGSGVRVVSDNARVTEISTLLEPQSRVRGLPQRLGKNARIAFQGSILLGKGFIISLAEREKLIKEDPRNAAVLKPLLNGEDLNSRPSSDASRAAIDFFTRTKSEASSYRGPFSVVEQTVRPERQRLKPDGTFVLRKPLPERWWQYAEKRPGLYGSIADLQFVIAITLVSKTVLPLRVSSRQIFSHALGVFATDDFADLTLLSSMPHQMWAIKYGSGMRNDPRYTPSDVFETLPRPENTDRMRELGEQLDGFRREIMLHRQLGLTALYNLVNSPGVQGDADVDLIRSIHVQIDEAVMQAYGWSDISLDHGFHTYRQMERWTVSPAARAEILDRLLEENHRRAALEAQQNPSKSKRGKSFEDSERPEGAML